MKACDISNRTGPLTTADVAAMRRNGYELVIVGLQYPGPAYPAGQAHQQIAALVLGGMPHIEVYFESTDPAHAWSYVGAFHDRIERAWVACEDQSGVTDNVTLDAWLAFADALALPRQAGIYTSPMAWAQLAGVDSYYAGRPLWCASYDGAPNLQVPHFGGWQAPTMKQFSEHGGIPGLAFEVDFDYLEGTTMALSPPMDTPGRALLFAKLTEDNYNAEHPGRNADFGTHVAIEPAEVENGHRVYKVTLP